MKLFMFSSKQIEVRDLGRTGQESFMVVSCPECRQYVKLSYCLSCDNNRGYNLKEISCIWQPATVGKPDVE